MPFDGFVQWSPDPESTTARRPVELPAAKKRSAHRNNFRQQAIFAALFLLIFLGSAFTYVIVSSVGAQNQRLEKTPEEKRGAFFFSQQSAGAPRENSLLYGGSAPERAVIVYVHSDQVNNPQKITNPSRTLVWDREQEPFGETYATPTNTTPTNHRFPGQYADAENLLSYNMMRDYDPTIARYIQADPTGFRGGPNLYGYAGQNPVQLIDRLGLDDTADMAADEETLNAPPANMAAFNLALGVETGKIIPAAIGEVTGAARAVWNLVKRGPVQTECPDITLYRGVSSDSPNPGQYENAMNGTAEPLGGDASIDDHLLGDNNSSYTSWTDDPAEAYDFATNEGQTSGVILTKTFPSSSVISPTSGGLQIMQSSEVLIEGPVTGAAITPVR